MLLGLSQLRAGRASPFISLPPSAGAQGRLSGQRMENAPMKPCKLRRRRSACHAATHLVARAGRIRIPSSTTASAHNAARCSASMGSLADSFESRLRAAWGVVEQRVSEFPLF